MKTSINDFGNPGIFAHRPIPTSIKGQSSVEVLVYLGFFMLMFVSLSLVFVTQVNSDIVIRQSRLSQATAAQVAQSVDIALLAGPGFNATFPIPTQIGGHNYSINFTNAGSLYIDISNGAGAVPQVFFFPLSTRTISLSCVSPNAACIGNAMQTYTDIQGHPRIEWGVNATKGTIHIENVLDPKTGAPALRVG